MSRVVIFEQHLTTTKCKVNNFYIEMLFFSRTPETLLIGFATSVFHLVPPPVIQHLTSRDIVDEPKFLLWNLTTRK